jgi:hypothetical protein
MWCGVAGLTKASMIAALSDVGAAMDQPVMWNMRFVQSTQEGGVVADRYVAAYTAAVFGCMAAWLHMTAYDCIWLTDTLLHTRKLGGLHKHLFG